MRKIVFSILLISSVNVFAENTQIHINPEQIENLAIKVDKVVPSQEIPLLSAPAKVVVPVDREILLSAPQPGLLTRLYVNIGDHVKTGQTLAQVNSPELVNLQQQFLTAHSELNLASSAQNRDKKLVQEGVISQKRWQETQTQYIRKAAVVNEVKQLLVIAGMSSSEINTLAKTHKLGMALGIRSPIDGIVLERLATLGSRLNMQTPLYRIADLSKLWLEINVPQERLHNIHVGDQVIIPGSVSVAEINLLGRSVDPNNQTVLVRAEIKGTADDLRVGQNLNVQLMQNSEVMGFKVPNTAIAYNAGNSYVFVRNSDGFAVTQVSVVGKQNEDSLITGALTPSQQIAVEGTVALKANWLGMGGDE